MNILEQYIDEIHSVDPYTEEWTKKFNKEFVEVDVTINCYGSKSRSKRVFPLQEWERIKESGYFMG